MSKEMLFFPSTFDIPCSLFDIALVSCKTVLVGSPLMRNLPWHSLPLSLKAQL
jgi:hypothetical protein